MAKMKQGIFGPISGKLGPVVGATWNGIPDLRESPKKKKKSAKEQPRNWQTDPVYTKTLKFTYSEDSSITSFNVVEWKK